MSYDEHEACEATEAKLRDEIKRLTAALQTAHIAMTLARAIARAIPSVSTEYNFDHAINEARRALERK